MTRSLVWGLTSALNIFLTNLAFTAFRPEVVNQAAEENFSMVGTYASAAICPCFATRMKSNIRLTLLSSITRLKYLPAVKSSKAEVAGLWCSKCFGVNKIRGFSKGRFICLLKTWNVWAGVVALTTKILECRSASRLTNCTISLSHIACDTMLQKSDY